MTNNRFWFDVRNYIDMVHDEFLMTDNFQTKEAIWAAFWDGAECKDNGRYAQHPALMKAWQKGSRFNGTPIGKDYVQDLSASWGRMSKRKPSITHGTSAAIPLYDGSEITGHWILAEEGAVTASHWPFDHYREQEGYPCDLQTGRTMAVKNYAADSEAQKRCGRMANQYDERAVTGGAIIVSFDGIVMRGNMRVMAGQLAARWGTDGMYIDYLRNHCDVWGFSADDVMKYEHPRLLFLMKREQGHQYSPDDFKRLA